MATETGKMTEAELTKWLDDRTSAAQPIGDRLESSEGYPIHPVVCLDDKVLNAFRREGGRLATKGWSPDQFGEEFPVVEQQLREIAEQCALGLGVLYRLLQLLRAVPTSGTAFFIWAALRRTTELARGFDSEIRGLNLSIAASLPRLQVDNFVRVFAVSQEAALTPPGESIARAIHEGKQLNKVRDPFSTLSKRSGRRKTKMLTDQRLKELANLWPWVDSIYAESSRWVHMSNRHSGTAFRFIDERRFVGSTNSVPNLIDESLLADICWAMLQSTTGVTSLCASMVLETSNQLGINLT